MHLHYFYLNWCIFFYHLVMKFINSCYSVYKSITIHVHLFPSFFPILLSLIRFYPLLFSLSVASLLNQSSSLPTQNWLESTCKWTNTIHVTFDTICKLDFIPFLISSPKPCPSFSLVTWMFCKFKSGWITSALCDMFWCCLCLEWVAKSKGGVWAMHVWIGRSLSCFSEAQRWVM